MDEINNSISLLENALDEKIYDLPYINLNIELIGNVLRSIKNKKKDIIVEEKKESGYDSDDDSDDDSEEPSESITITEQVMPSEIYNLTTANIVDSVKSKYNLANDFDKYNNDGDDDIIDM